MPAWLWAVAGVLVLAGASIFFALAESALFSLSKWQTQHLAEREPRRGGLVSRLLGQPRDLLATIVLGNALSNAMLIGVVLWAALELEWSLTARWLEVAGLFVVVLVGCELVPKTLAVRSPESWSLRVACPMVWVQWVIGPLRRAAGALSLLLFNLLVPKSVGPQTVLSDGEYHELLELAHQQGTIDASEKEIILQILRLDQKTAGDVMKPRSQMACLADDLSVEDMIRAARRFKHHRLPLYDETPDTIVGVLNTRTFLADPQADLAEAIEFPSFVPESMNLLQLLKSLQRQRRGIAIVLDEFGGTAGLVTMGDILEETIGELRSEGEEQGFLLEKLGPGRWRVNGIMRIEDFQREYPAVGHVPEVDTMGGLLVALRGVVPAVGESAVYRGLRLTATAGDERRVRELLVESAERKGVR